MSIYLLDNPDGNDEFLTIGNWDLNTVASSSAGFDQSMNVMHFSPYTGPPDPSLFLAVIQATMYQNNRIRPTTGSRRIKVEVSDGSMTTSATTMVYAGTNVIPPPLPPPEPRRNPPGQPGVLSDREAQDRAGVRWFIAWLSSNGYDLAAVIFQAYLDQSQNLDINSSVPRFIPKIQTHADSVIKGLIYSEWNRQGRPIGTFRMGGPHKIRWIMTPLSLPQFLHLPAVQLTPALDAIHFAASDEEAWSFDNYLFFAYGGAWVTVTGDFTVTRTVAPLLARVKITGTPTVTIHDAGAFVEGDEFADTSLRIWNLFTGDLGTAWFDCHDLEKMFGYPPIKSTVQWTDRTYDIYTSMTQAIGR